MNLMGSGGEGKNRGCVRDLCAGDWDKFGAVAVIEYKLLDSTGFVVFCLSAWFSNVFLLLGRILGSAGYRVNTQ